MPSPDTRSRIARLVATGALALALAGCGDSGPLSKLGVGGPSGPPPPVEVSTGDTTLSLDPWTYCYGNGCADGTPPENPESIGSPDSVEVSYPLTGWHFEATFVETGAKCPRRITVADLGDASPFTLFPAGPAGTWNVDLFGRGDGGDVATTFQWTTPVDGWLPEPSGSAVVLAGHDGEIDSYGVELGVRDLAETPRKASATITVESGEGHEVTLEPHRNRGCYSAGEVSFGASDSVGRRATTIGSAPFTYTARITLDGTTYVGTGVWPDDEIKDQAPTVALTFTPPLPAYVGD